MNNNFQKIGLWFGFLFVLTGTIVALIDNLQVTYYEYRHPWFLLLSQFISAFINLPTYYVIYTHFKYSESREQYMGEFKAYATISDFILPALFDFVNSGLVILASNIISAGLNMTFRSSAIPLVSLSILCYNKFILSNILFRHHWVGIAICFIGQLLFGFMKIENIHSYLWLGAIFILISSVFRVIKLLTEQRIFIYKQIHPFKAAGYIGLWGTLFSGLTFFGVSFINCHQYEIFQPFCFKYDEKDYSFDNLKWALWELKENYLLMFLYVLQCIGLMFYTYFDLFMGKVSTPVLRVLVDNFRMFPVIIVFLLLNCCYTAMIGQIISIVIILIGMLIFIEILKIRIFNLDKFIQRDYEELDEHLTD